MKKTIIALFAIATMAIKSQNTCTVTVVKVQPDTIQINDTLQILFTFTATPTPTPQAFNYFMCSPVTNTNIVGAWSFSYTEFYTMPKVVYNGDTCRLLEIVLSVYYPEGFSIMNGHYFYYDKSYTVGIEKHSPTAPQPKYTDIFTGNSCNKESNKILNEWVGTKPRKILILE